MNTQNSNTIEIEALQFIKHSLEEQKSIDDIINELRISILAKSAIEQQLHYLQTIAQYVLEQANEHFKTCSNPKRCEEAMIWRDLLFFINQLQDEFGIGLNNEDVFTQSEIEIIKERIKNFIQQYRSEETIYLTTEIKELENFFFIGKKNWSYLLLGKAYSMKNDELIDEACFKSILSISNFMLENE